MLNGWRDQQLARNLKSDTIVDRLAAVRRFQRFTNDWPWQWRPVDVEEFAAELRGADGAGRALSTMRAYHSHLRLFEAWLPIQGTCGRCQLKAMIADLLAGPTGGIPEQLQPLADALCSMRRPNSGVTWIRSNPRVPALLRDLATGQTALTHDALDGLPAPRTVAYLRELLVGCGSLPPRDRNLAVFERWLGSKLDAITDVDQRRLIQRFARWRLLRGLREQARQGPVPTNAFLRAKQSTTVATQFLAWLAERGRSLPECTQHDIDAWLAGGTSTRGHVARFLSWAADQRIVQQLAIRPPARPGRGISDAERLAHLRDLLQHDHLPLAFRIAGALILLFGQPIRRIVALRTEHVQVDSTSVRVLLGGDWIEVPEPLAELLRQHLHHRDNTNTAANPDSPWLFPGRMPGKSLTQQAVVDRLRQAGIHALTARTGTWLQLVREAPPSVLADALGTSPKTAMRYATLAGTNFLTYASLRHPPAHHESEADPAPAQ